jgi:hypothetical protein
MVSKDAWAATQALLKESDKRNPDTFDLYIYNSLCLGSRINMDHVVTFFFSEHRFLFLQGLQSSPQGYDHNAHKNCEKRLEGSLDNCRDFDFVVRIYYSLVGF